MALHAKLTYNSAYRYITLAWIFKNLLVFGSKINIKPIWTYLTPVGDYHFALLYPPPALHSTPMFRSEILFEYGFRDLDNGFYGLVELRVLFYTPPVPASQPVDIPDNEWLELRSNNRDAYGREINSTNYI
jgi:hypothetical protein